MINVKQLVPGTAGQAAKVNISTGKAYWEDESGYYVAAGRHGFGATAGIHTAADRGVELQVGSASAFAASAASGKTVYVRTQTGGGSGNSGGNLILITGASGGGAGRAGYVNSTNAGAGVHTTFIGEDAGTLATGAENTLYGYSAGYALTSGKYSTIVGASAGPAISTASNSCFFGYQAGLTATGGSNCLFGFQAGDNIGAGTANLCMGHGADVGLTTSSYAVALGAYSASIGSSVAIGAYSICSSSNQFVSGSEGHPINNVYFGKGVNNTSAAAYTINGTGGSGTNNAGADVIIAGGKGTGNAAGGKVLIQTAPRGATGGTPNTPGTRLDVSQYGLVTHTPAAAMNLAGDVVPAAVPPEWTLTAAAHGASPGAGILASTERHDVLWNLTREVRFDTGALTWQRAVKISGPTYSFVAASVITMAATIYIDPPTPSTNCTITNAYALYLGGSIYTAANIHITATPAVSTGTVVTLTARSGIAFALGEVGYIYSDGTVDKAKADAAATAPVMVICAEPGAGIVAGGSGKFLLAGILENAGWNWTTLGGLVYLSAAAAGALTQAQPAATDNVIQVVGVALSATKILFKASTDVMTHT